MKDVVKVIVRDGSHLFFGFDKHRRVFFGIETLFVSNAFESISFFLFEYFTKSCFLLHIFNHGGCEISTGSLVEVVDDAVLTLPGMKIDKYFSFGLKC